MTSTPRPSPFLRWMLLADAGASAAVGLLMVGFARALAGLLLVPATLLVSAGLILLPYAAIVAYLSTRNPIPRRAVWAVITCNVLWAVDCGVIAFSGWVEPSALGYAFILAQALVVAAFAELQYIGLRRTPAIAHHGFHGST